jgi:polysaccharide deacetylase 2 family uncharacterized protein YibQ
MKGSSMEENQNVMEMCCERLNNGELLQDVKLIAQTVKDNIASPSVAPS